MPPAPPLPHSRPCCPPARRALTATVTATVTAPTAALAVYRPLCVWDGVVGVSAAPTHHGAGVENDGDHLAPSELGHPDDLLLHQLLNRAQPPVVPHVRAGEVAPHADHPLVLGAGPDIVVPGDEVFEMPAFAAVLCLHGFLEIQVRLPCRRINVRNAAETTWMVLNTYLG
jgi:hypothetical protein